MQKRIEQMKSLQHPDKKLEDATTAKIVKTPPPHTVVLPPKKTWCSEHPLWEPVGAVGLFNEILRSPVFANLPKGKKVHNIDKNLLCWGKGLNIRLSGPQLVQLDLGCYMGIRSFFRYDEDDPDNQYAFFSLRELEKRTGKKSSCMNNQKILRDSIKRQLEATLYVYSETEKKELFGGHFIEEFIYDPSRKLYRVKLNLSLIKLNKNGCTWIDLDDWNGLSHGVARLLYGFLSTHHSTMKDMTIVKLETLRTRFEMKTSLKDFKQKVMKAIEELLEKKILHYAEVKGTVLYAARLETSGLKVLNAPTA